MEKEGEKKKTQGERRKVALIVAELSGACVFPWWVIYWCLSGMNRSKAARWQAINHASNQGWQSSNKTENKENQLLPVPPPEKNNFSIGFCTITAFCLPDQKTSLEVIKKGGKKPLQRDIKGCCFPVKCTGQMPRCVPFCWLLFRECQVQPGYGLTHF